MQIEKLVYGAVKISKVPFLGGRIAQIVKNVVRVLFSCDISYQITMGNNLILPHKGLGVVIGPGVVLGNNCKIYQNVTIGAKDNGGK